MLKKQSKNAPRRHTFCIGMVGSQTMEFICAANWKMNQDMVTSQEFLEDFFTQVSAQDLKHFMFFPPALLATQFAQHNDSDLKWGAQNFYYADQGAFTGENSPELYKKMGAQVMLIGHSERRTLFTESDDQIHLKLKKCLELSLIPVLCVGETLQERESGKATEVIKTQIHKALGDLGEVTNLVVAYEPVWAIGTGKVASVADVAEMHDFIKKEVGQHVPVLYGGSVKAENAGELFAINNVNGFLIGGASLKCDSLLSIFKEMKLQL